MKKGILALLGASLCLASCQKTHTPGFAVVIDPQSYEEARTEVDEYLNTVESRGLHPILVIDRWGVPDSIRAELIELYNDKEFPIEGCVFIGDIPIAKVRDAQFMTSAFKMEQGGRHAMADYCVSTDRFYDSFDLQWTFLQQDTARSEYFYYSLDTDCPQVLRPTIYSARIMPRTNGSGDKYEKLRRYLQRVNEADAVNNPMDHVLSFGGHGNLSNSWTARMDEKIEMRDQLPWIKSQWNGILYLDFREEDFIKDALIQELQKPGLDYAILHHHGSEEEQLLSGTPVSASFETNLKSVRDYVHTKTRQYVQSGKTMAEAQKSIGLYLKSPFPEEWMKEAFDEAVIAADEARAYAEDLHVDDFTYYHPQVRMVLLDACFNGSFHKDRSIQESYLFSEGSGTLIAIANSVNSIQDSWANRYVGMAGLGMRVGYFAFMNTTLESHVFGDPTFCFTPAADCSFNVNREMTNYDAGFWKKQLDNEYPAVQILAAYMLAERCKGNHSDLLAAKFRNSQYGIVRLAALMELACYNDGNFLECIRMGLSDGLEMVQRFAVLYAGDRGDESLLSPLMSLFCESRVSERVAFDLGSTLGVFDSVSVYDAFNREFPKHSYYVNPDSIRKLKLQILDRNTSLVADGFEDEVLNPATNSERSRINNVKQLRNSPAHFLVPEILDYLSEPKEVQLQCAMLEALGWFELSYMAPAIAEKAQQIMNDDRFDESVRKEARRTYNRLK